MKTWVVAVGVLLVAPLATRGQSLAEFYRWPSVATITVVDYVLFFNLQQATPPPSYIQSWYREMEECTGVQKPLGGVGWFWADGMIDLGEQQTNSGMYYFVPPEIVLLRYQSPEDHKANVRHEVLHRLLATQDQDPEELHQDETFRRCLGSPS